MESFSFSDNNEMGDNMEVSNSSSDHGPIQVAPIIFPKKNSTKRGNNIIYIIIVPVI
jgi:hypothetical protein